MPEGDTVLRTARRLNQAFSGRPLVRNEFRWPGLGDANLAGRVVLQTVAHGKQILTRFASAADSAAVAGTSLARPRFPTVPDGPLTLRSHLRMEGRWTVSAATNRWPTGSGPTIRAILANAEWMAVGTWLGLLDLVPTDVERQLIGHLGPDILADDPDGTGLAAAADRIRAWPDREIGAALLDQTGVAGIGTMYMAEALFLEHVSPWLPVSAVDVPAVLRRARRLLQGGVTMAVPSTTGNNQRGHTTYVHARSGRPCFRCGTTIRVAEIGVPPKQRPAFYCPACQPGPAPTDDGRPQNPLGANPQVREFRRPAGYRRR